MRFFQCLHRHPPRSAIPTYHLKQLSAFILVLCATVTPLHATANEIQGRICNAALGFGQAKARIELFGRVFNGAIPADQLADIATNLSNAAAEIGAAETLMSGPIAEDRRRQGVPRNVLEGIERLIASGTDIPYRQRAARVSSLFQMYREGLGVTYESSRGDALRKSANCDFFIAEACYHYGRATIASAIDENFARSYQIGAIGSFRAAIENGLDLAMDWPEHRPYNGHARKICCTMGSPSAWDAMQLSSFGSSTSLNVFARREGILRGIINTANALDPVCASSGVYCPSTVTGDDADPRYEGCYADQGDPTGTGGRDLSGSISSSASMTVERCISECARQGYQYAGLQYASYCFCGNSFGGSGESGACGMACAGDPSQVCGGSWANSVYRTSGGSDLAPAPDQDSGQDSGGGAGGSCNVVPSVQPMPQGTLYEYAVRPYGPGVKCMTAAEAQDARNHPDITHFATDGRSCPLPCPEGYVPGNYRGEDLCIACPGGTHYRGGCCQ